MDEQMTLPGIDVLEWQYDEDTGNVMCRCPDCGGRLVIGFYTDRNPYRFCPYCGVRLREGKLKQKRAQVYGWRSAFADLTEAEEWRLMS